MKAIVTLLSAFCLTALLVSCGKSDHDHGDHHDHATHDMAVEASDKTDALYDEVMALHDEGMEKMDDLYKLKQELKNKVTSSKDMVTEKQQELETVIQQIDSASRGMMVWMRQFQPETDSLDEESYKSYLEAELAKVKKVRQDILDAIERAKETE